MFFFFLWNYGKKISHDYEIVFVNYPWRISASDSPEHAFCTSRSSTLYNNVYTYIIIMYAAVKKCTYIMVFFLHDELDTAAFYCRKMRPAAYYYIGESVWKSNVIFVLYIIYEEHIVRIIFLDGKRGYIVFVRYVSQTRYFILYYIEWRVPIWISMDRKAYTIIEYNTNTII